MDWELERLFQEKFLSQTKNLANGKKIKIFSRKLRNDGSFDYSCHLCGVTEIGNEHDLHIHVKGQLHSDLMGLDKIPLRSWMESVIILDETEKKNCAFGCGNCSDLKALLESSDIKSFAKKREDEKARSRSNYSSDSSYRGKESSRKRFSKSQRVKSPDKKKRRSHKKDKKSRSHSKKSSHSRHERSESHELSPRRSYQKVYIPATSSRICNRSEFDQNPATTFLSICRYLVTLEQHISKYSTDIKGLFMSSLELERQKTGSSNKLLTTNNLKILGDLKHHLKDQIVLGLLPMKMLGVARSFVNEFDQLVKENETLRTPPAMNKKKLLIDFELTKELTETSSISSTDMEL